MNFGTTGVIAGSLIIGYLLKFSEKIELILLETSTTCSTQTPHCLSIAHTHLWLTFNAVAFVVVVAWS